MSLNEDLIAQSLSDVRSEELNGNAKDKELIMRTVRIPKKYNHLLKSHGLNFTFLVRRMLEEKFDDL